MVQSGLPDEWWDCATECYCHLRNVHDKMADDKTAHDIFGVKFDGPLIPFGVRARYKPISSIDEARLYQCGKKKDASCNFQVLRAEGGWSGDLLIAGCEDPENLLASRHSRQAVQAPGSRTGRKAFVSMCRRISQTLRFFFDLHAAKCSIGDTLSKTCEGE